MQKRLQVDSMLEARETNQKNPSGSFSLNGRIGRRKAWPNRVWKICLRLADYKFPVSPSKKISPEMRQQIKSLLRAGDVLLESNNAHPFAQLLSKLFFGSSWIHSAVYVGNGEIVDAGRKASVVKISVDTFLDTTDIAIYRPSFAAQGMAEEMCDFAVRQVGRPFNYRFDDSDDHSFYCAQLVASALRSMKNPIELERCNVLATRVFNCASIVRSPQMQCIWSSNPQLLVNLGSHWPIIAGFLIGGALLTIAVLPFALLRSLKFHFAFVGACFGTVLTVISLHRHYEKTK